MANAKKKLSQFDMHVASVNKPTQQHHLGHNDIHDNIRRKLIFSLFHNIVMSSFRQKQSISALFWQCLLGGSWSCICCWKPEV